MDSIFSKQTWQIEEIVRGVGYPDLNTTGLDGHFLLQQINLLSYSEDLGRIDTWSNNAADAFQYIDQTLGVTVEEITVSTVSATRDPDGFWLTLPEQIGRVSQQVAVAPGETYNLSFYVAGVADFAAATLAIFNATTGILIGASVPYGTQLSANGLFVRIIQSFIVPADCTSVRLELISAALPFLLISDTADYAEYAPLAPASFLEGTETITVGNQTISVQTAIPTER